MTLRKLTSYLFLTALLAACGSGSGDGLDQNGLPTDDSEGNQEVEVLQPTLTSIQEQVFTPICSRCHIGAAAPRGLQLDSVDNSLAFLVDFPSVGVPSILRVSIGDADNSYLIQKLLGTAAVGGQMPLGGSPLPTETIDVIKQWINEGANVN